MIDLIERSFLMADRLNYHQIEKDMQKLWKEQERYLSLIHISLTEYPDSSTVTGI